MLIQINDDFKTINEWSKILGIQYTILLSRIKKGTTGEALKALPHPGRGPYKYLNERVFIMANGFNDRVKELKELQAFIKQLEDEADTIKTEIMTEMEARGVDTVQTDLFTVKYTVYQSTRLDTNRLKAEHSDLYSVYSKTTEARRLSIA